MKEVHIKIEVKEEDKDTGEIRAIKKNVRYFSGFELAVDILKGVMKKTGEDNKEAEGQTKLIKD